MKILFSFILMFGVVSSAFSQENDDGIIACFAPQAPPRLYFGLTGGYGRIFHSEGISNPLNNRDFQPVQSNSLFIGFLSEYLVGEFPRDGSDISSSLVLKAYYFNFNLAKQSYSEISPFQTQNGQQIVAELNNVAVFDASFMNTELLFFERLFGSIFSIGGGLGAAFPLSSSIEKRKEIHEPADMSLSTDDVRYRSEQNGRALVFKEDAIAKTNFYAKIGLLSDFGLFNYKLIASPSVFYNFGLNKAASTESFKINALQFGVDFKFAL